MGLQVLEKSRETQAQWILKHPPNQKSKHGRTNIYHMLFLVCFVLRRWLKNPHDLKDTIDFWAPGGLSEGSANSIGTTNGLYWPDFSS